ncbi:MAG: DNA-directed RNA polymerase subunit beta, partial [Thermodesulfobacteriota bacterium]
MASSLINGQFLRKDFSRIDKVVEIPDLVEIQKTSYHQFLQADLEPDKRKELGLELAFKSVFPIKDFSGLASLEYINYKLMEPKYTTDECHEKGMTYAAPIKVMVRLLLWDSDPETGVQSIRDIKEHVVYFGEVPLMTENGSFIINGTERVIVSQLHRSPGVFFEYQKGKSSSSDRVQYTARIIPYHGSWLDFEFDQKEWLYVRIDKRRKMLVTILLKALGYSIEEMLNYFYPSEEIVLKKRKIQKSVDPDYIIGQRVSSDIVDPKSGETIIKKERKFTRAAVKKILAAGIKYIIVDVEHVIGRIASRDIVDPATGEVILECNQVLTREKLDEISDRGIDRFKLLFIEMMGPSLRETLLNDRVSNDEIKEIAEFRKNNPDDHVSNMTLNARIEIYRRLKPGDPPTIDTATTHFNNLFFTADRYNLSKVGRLKINRKLGFDDVPLEHTTLRKEDIFEVVHYLLGLKNGFGMVDDIDHLGNRRIRRVGELL